MPDKKKIGIVSYNIYCNFTNYGSALQSWALFNTINRISNNKYEAVLVDYCPDVLADSNPLNPIKNMWDKDEETIRMIELSMPAIKENYYKFDDFYNNRFNKTVRKYTSDNFDEVVEDEHIDGFVCGSDTIFCIDEFNGFDDGYFANYNCMKNGFAISYAASFGDAKFDSRTYSILNERLQNFKALGIRESNMIEYVKQNTNVEVQQTIDPTLLLEGKDYEKITNPPLIEEKYLLIYSRRYNEKMEKYAEEIATKNGWKVVEISIRMKNKENHRMFYEAGVEDFLSLVKNAQCVITNSFHGLIFCVQFRKLFYVFSRESGDSKILGLLSLMGLSDRLRITGNEKEETYIDYDKVHEKIAQSRAESFDFLRRSLNLL